MLAAGLELGEVMQAGSWKSIAMVARYGERLLARRGAQAGCATKQGLKARSACKFNRQFRVLEI